MLMLFDSNDCASVAFKGEMRLEIVSNADSVNEGTARVDILPTIWESLAQVVIDDADEESRNFKDVSMGPIPTALTNTTFGPDVDECSVDMFPATGDNEMFLATGHNVTNFETDKTTMLDCSLLGEVFMTTPESEYHKEDTQNVPSIRLFTELSLMPKPPDKNAMLLLPVAERNAPSTACNNSKNWQLGF